MTAATLTGPASGPRPASSTPATHRKPPAIASPLEVEVGYRHRRRGIGRKRGDGGGELRWLLRSVPLGGHSLRLPVDLDRSRSADWLKRGRAWPLAFRRSLVL